MTKDQCRLVLGQEFFEFCYNKALEIENMMPSVQVKAAPDLILTIAIAHLMSRIMELEKKE